MSFNLSLVEFDLTVLTDNLGVRFFIMFVLFGFGHNIATLLAFVVIPCASHFVQTEFAKLNLLLTGATLLARLIACGYLVSLH